MNENKDQARAADAPSELSDDDVFLLADTHAVDSAEDGCRTFDRGGLLQFAADLRAADALDSQPTVSAVLAELRADLRELANNTETFGEHSQEAARVALDGATDALDEVAAKYTSSQPTDGGVRNG